MNRVADGEIAEAVVWYLWQHHLPTDVPMRLTDGCQLRVHDTGRLNKDSGPDFRDAALAFGPSQPVKRDVEIHVRPLDWTRHGHHTDPRYNSVMLHVVMWHDGGDPAVLKQNGQYVPTLILSENLADCFEKLHRRYERSSGPLALYDAYPCRALAKGARTVVLIDRLADLGDSRFEAKSSGFLLRMQRVDPEQVIYEGVMRAVGYAKNSDAFLDLAQRLPLAAIKELVPDRAGISFDCGRSTFPPLDYLG